MQLKKWYWLAFLFLLGTGHRAAAVAATITKNLTDSVIHGEPAIASTGKTTPDELIAFARTLLGTPYHYGSTNPALGFDCSGFITYVFNHFEIAVPRSSVEFKSFSQEVDLKDARTGDLILFTGTNSKIRTIGHIGIILSNTGDEIKFIHSTSGAAYGVTETPLNAYYMGRYVKIVRVFAQNNQF